MRAEKWVDGGSGSDRGPAWDAMVGSLAGYVLMPPPLVAVRLRMRVGYYIAHTMSSQRAPRLMVLDGLAGNTPPVAYRPAALPVAALRPVRSGHTYCITSPPERGLVRPELARALQTVFERFALERGFTPKRPLEIHLASGFRPNSHGHGEGRAVDIDAVGGTGLRQWKVLWDRAIAVGEESADPVQRSEALANQRASNLGRALYRTLQRCGGWRVNPSGWRVYRGVMQLFGPWTATEGPWKTMQIEDPSPYQRQRLADQQWVFRAHQDHIHVAR
jgi:hypothetical protein